MAVWDDTRVKPHVRAAAKEISETFGITNIGGFATSGHIPDSDHYKGLAIDVMTTLKGQQIANWATQNAGRLSITYVIWNRHIWDSRNNRGWEPYHGTSPHTDHVHISFFSQPGSGADASQNFGGENSAGSMGCSALLSAIGLLVMMKGK